MTLGNPIKLRLHPEQQRQLRQEAAARGMSFGAYLRARLEQSDGLGQQFIALRRLIEDGKRSTAQSATDASMMIEMLLLLRSVVGGDKLRIVHGELRRHGLPVWTGEKEPENEQH